MTQSAAELVERARIKSSMLRMGEPVAFGSDADIIDELASTLEAQQAQIEKLVEALKPFAKIAEGEPDTLLVSTRHPDFRRARSSLKELTGE